MAVFVSGINIDPSLLRPRALPGYAKPVWSVAVGPWRGGPEFELTRVKNRQLSVKLDGPDTFSFSLAGDHPEAKLITELEDDIWVTRNGRTMARNRVLSSEDAVQAPYDVTFGTSSYAELLNRRLLRSEPDSIPNFTFPGAASTISGQPSPGFLPMDIVKYLILHTEAQYGMKLGLSFGQFDTKLIPKPYETELFDEDGNSLGPLAGAENSGAHVIETGTPIFKAIQDMQALAPGFDFWIGPDLTVNVSLQRGADKGVVLDYGGIINSFSRRFDSENFTNVLEGVMNDPAKPEWFPKGARALGHPAHATHYAGSALRIGADMTATKDSKTITSVTANFVAADVGTSVLIQDVQYVINAVTNESTAVLNTAYKESSGTSLTWVLGGSSGVLTNVHGNGTFSTLPQGGWASTRTFDTINPAVLQAMTKQAYNSMNDSTYLDQPLRKSTSYQVTFVRGAWEGPNHVWVGDLVWFAANRGRVNVYQKMRVTEVTISIDSNGVETVSLTMNNNQDKVVALKRFKQLVRDLAKNKAKKA